MEYENNATFDVSEQYTTAGIYGPDTPLHNEITNVLETQNTQQTEMQTGVDQNNNGITTDGITTDR